MSEQSQSSPYALGSSQRETERLVSQAELIEASTRQLFEDAGIRPGMTVLDIGSGAGDVTLLAREFVGETGRVVGVDKDAISTTRARERAQEAGLTNVSFVEADVSADLSFDNEFDAIVGRRVLTYLPTRAETLRRLLKYLRPGGVVAFQEVNTEGSIPAFSPPSELYERLQAWANKARAATGMDLSMGSHLEQLFIDCGLTIGGVRPPEPAPVSTSEASHWLDVRLGVMRSTIPAMREHEVAPAEELDRLEEYLEAAKDEIEGEGKLPIGGIVDYRVWARKPL